ncbi:MAG: DegV family protein [Defluviitaleaceae bacterium]|nr:DegV family protein [Defluviitaleaceae bacterium]
MYKFQIVTDSCANLTDAVIEKYNLHILNLSYLLNGEEKVGYIKGQKIDHADFYNKLRDKNNKASTSQATPASTIDVARPILEAGEDVLFVVLSSGLSGTFDAVQQGAKTLLEEFPERKIICVDSLCATSGIGALVLEAARLRDEGKEIGEVAVVLDKIRHNVLHYFTIDDLFHLKRGGRLSAVKAIMGSALNVKPLLTVSKEGKLVPIGKARGRVKALDGLVDAVSAIEPSVSSTVYIVHADVEKDAEYCAAQIREKHKGLTPEIVELNPVIGIHSGPGTVAIIFFGNKERDV